MGYIGARLRKMRSKTSRVKVDFVMYMWLFVALIAAVVFWEIGTGKTRMWAGSIVYAKDDPATFWISVWFKIGMILFLLFVRYVLHVSN